MEGVSLFPLCECFRLATTNLKGLLIGPTVERDRFSLPQTIMMKKYPPGCIHSNYIYIRSIYLISSVFYSSILYEPSLRMGSGGLMPCPTGSKMLPFNWEVVSGSPQNNVELPDSLMTLYDRHNIYDVLASNISTLDRVNEAREVDSVVLAIRT